MTKHKGARDAMPAEAPQRIGDVARALSISADTLRYYEKIGLMPRAAKHGGTRYYDAAALSRLRFIRRAQTFKFSLAEIEALLALRQKPAQAKPEARALAASKLEHLRHALAEMTVLQRELALLLNLCEQTACGCAIIEGIEGLGDMERTAGTPRAKAPKPKPRRAAR